MRITEKRLRQLIREAAAGDDYKRMLGMAEEIADRTVDNLLQELTELLSPMGPAGERAVKLASGSRVASTGWWKQFRRTLRRAAADAVALAHNLA